MDLRFITSTTDDHLFSRLGRLFTLPTHEGFFNYMEMVRMSLTTKEMIKLMHNEFMQIMNTQHDEIVKLNNYVRASVDNVAEMDRRIRRLEKGMLQLQESGCF